MCWSAAALPLHSWCRTKGPAVKGNIHIDYEGLLEGKPFQGGTAKNQAVQLGGRMIPGFERAFWATRRARIRDLRHLRTVTTQRIWPVNPSCSRSS